MKVLIFFTQFNFIQFFFQVKIWFQNRRMKWRNSKERELIAQGGCREQTLPTKHNPNPDLSDPQPLPSPQHQRPQHANTPPRTPLEAMAKTRLAFNETLWTLPPPLPQAVLAGNSNEDDESSDINDETHDEIDEDDIDEDEDEEIRVT